MAGTQSTSYRRTVSICPEDIDFAEKVPKQLTVECPICMAVLFNPHIVSCCGNHFCETCLQRVKDDNQPCPLCKESEYTSFLNKSLMREINQLLVRCPQNQGEGPIGGCPWVGDFGMLENHLSIGERYGECQHVTVGCMYGCGHTDKRSNLQTHEQTICSKRPFSCDYCGEYESTCEDVTENHWKVCSQYIVPCPNECDKKYHKRADLSWHLQQECELQVIACTFVWAGCDVQVMRCDLHEHLEAYIGQHLSKVCSANSELSDTVRELKDKTKLLYAHKEESEKMAAQLRSEDAKNKQEIEMLRNAVALLTERLDSLQTKHQALHEQITYISNESRQEKERLARRSFCLESMIGVPPFSFVMDNFDERLAEGTEWFSPSLLHSHWRLQNARQGNTERNILRRRHPHLTDNLHYEGGV